MTNRTTERWNRNNLRRRVSAMGRRRRIGLGLLGAVMLVGSWLLAYWWTSWPVRRAFRETFEMSSLAISPDGRTFATGGFGREGIVFRDVPTGRRVSGWTYPLPPVRAAIEGKFSPDGRIFAFSWVAPALSGTETLKLDLIDVGSGQGRASISVRSGALTSNGFDADLVFTADGRTVRFFAGDERESEVLDCDVATSRVSARHPVTHHDGFVKCLAPDGRLLAVIPHVSQTDRSGSAEVIFWAFDRDREVARLPRTKATSKAWAVSFSGDGRRLGVGRDDGSIELWDLGTNRLQGRLFPHRPGYVPRILRLTHDGSTVASVGVLHHAKWTTDYFALSLRRPLGYWRVTGAAPASEVIILDVASGRRTARVANEYWPVLSPDGRIIATTDGIAKLRDVPTRPRSPAPRP